MGRHDQNMALSHHMHLVLNIIYVIGTLAFVVCFGLYLLKAQGRI